jgi:hypothetical protein
MSANPGRLSRWLLHVGAGVVLLATAGWAWPPPTASVAVPPVPQGAARVWFYRDLEPYETLARPFIRMNEGVVGISEPGGTFYRDVAPGHYHVSVDSYLTDFNQTRDVDLTLGQQVYFKVLPSRVICGGGGRGGDGDCMRNNFYVWTIPPEVAQAAVARSPFFGGG